MAGGVAVLAAGVTLGRGPRREEGEGLGEAVRALSSSIQTRDVGGVVRALDAVADAGTLDAARAILSSYAAAEDWPDDAVYPEDRYRIHINAARALARVRDRETIVALKKMVRTEKHWAARFLILTAALSNPDLDLLAISLEALREDRHPVVLRRAAQNLGRSRSKEAVGALITFFEALEKKMGPRRTAKPLGGKPTSARAYRGPEWDRVWLAVHDALDRLIARSFASAADYRNWYEAHKDEIDPANPTPAAAERTGLGLFGLDVTGWNIAFVIDISGSMETTDPWPDGKRPRGPITSVDPEAERERLLQERMRIARAKKELEAVVLGLSEDRRFNLISFASDVSRWQDYQVPATKENRKKAAAFIRQMEAEGITVTDWAIEQAFLDPAVDTIYLVTDGAPTHVGGGGPDLPPDAPKLIQRIIERVRALNYRRGVRIYTLGFRGAEEEFLRTLAAENSGKYKAIR